MSILNYSNFKEIFFKNGYMAAMPCSIACESNYKDLLKLA